YNDDIIICDVSSRNPNVMFELGMRIAFDKPVVIIKDNATQYCFDSGTIEHLEYPKDMRYSEIEKFKALLKQKIENTIDHHKSNPEASPILNSFGSFTAIKPNLPEMSEADLFKSDLQEIKYLLAKSLRNQDDLWNGTTNWIKEQFPKEMFGSTDDEIFANVTSVPGIKVEGVDDKYVYVLARTTTPLKILFRKFRTGVSQNSLGLND
ncbi:TPA: hypothetical protein ACRG2W_005280, partial [Klebsiella pneumoniae]